MTPPELKAVCDQLAQASALERAAAAAYLIGTLMLHLDELTPKERGELSGVCVRFLLEVERLGPKRPR